MTRQNILTFYHNNPKVRLICKALKFSLLWFSYKARPQLTQHYVDEASGPTNMIKSHPEFLPRNGIGKTCL